MSGALVYKILEKIIFKLVTGKTVWQGRRRASTSHAPARHAHRPTSASAPHPAQGRPPSQAAPSPRACAPRLIRVLPGHVSSCPRRTGRARATDRRSDGSAPPYAHRSRPGTTTVSLTSAAVTPEPSRTYKYPAFPPLPPALSHRRAIHAAAVEMRPSLPSTVEQPPKLLP
jgi:hypothetical protein